MPLPAWLVPPPYRFLTPNRYDATNRADRVRSLEAVVLHYTAWGPALETVRWFLREDAKASAHFVVGRAGEVYQLAPLDARTWHAGSPKGTSSWNGLPPNYHALGIEVANLGQLHRGDAGEILDCYDRPYAGQPWVSPLDGSAWDPYPSDQLEAVSWLLELLGLEPALRRASPGPLPRLVGHEQVDPTRKVDPGPALWGALATWVRRWET